MIGPGITAEERDQFALEDELDGKAIARATEWDFADTCD